MDKLRAQASFFDGILFMLVVIASVSLMFLSLNTYAVAQDKVLRTAYLSTYLQSSAKMIYFVDAATLRSVKDYCNDPELSTGGGSYYCTGGEAYKLNCNELGRFQGRISVADLVKKDVDYSDGSNQYKNLDDKYGTADQLGRTALRCAMKEVMKPFTFSGFRYITEVAEAATGTDAVIYAADQKYASDFMFSPKFQALTAVKKQSFDCEAISSDPEVQSDQLLVIRTPFKILRLAASGFESDNYVLRTCLWPSNDILTS